MMKLLYILSILAGASILEGCSSTEGRGYRYSHCYQPLYWPSDCVDDVMPNARERSKKRRAEFHRRNNL